MRHVLNKLLCFLFIHPFESVERDNQFETVVCERCGATWVVDHTLHIMEPLKEVV
jgi:hypothetical protein